MTKGTITRLIADRGYGFIQTEEKEDVFFHRNELVGIAYESLREGQQVEFEVIHALKGTKSGQYKARQAEQVESFIYRKPSEVDIPPAHW